MAKAWVFGDNISTDLIIPGRYLADRNLEKLADHAMEDANPEFADKVKEGDILVAGKNFGCGSSREHASLALKAAGISAIFAESFARIFYRNAINLGIPAFFCLGIRREFKTGDEVGYNLKEGIVRNLDTGKIFKAEPLPTHILEIIRSGGLIQHLRNDFI